MKKYRLKKDLPTVRAGEVFVRKTNETMQTDMIYHVDSEDVFLPPSIEVDDIINFDEWFEEVKEFKEWKPKEGEQYLYIGPIGRPCIDAWRSVDHDSYRFSIGNCYPTDTPDGVIIREQKLIPQAMHRLKMAAKKAWFEFNGSEGPDWKSAMQDKYYIYHGHSFTGEKVHIVDTHSVQVFGCVYFPTEESCRAYINNNPEDMKLLFGVE